MRAQNNAEASTSTASTGKRTSACVRWSQAVSQGQKPLSTAESELMPPTQPAPTQLGCLHLWQPPFDRSDHRRRNIWLAGSNPGESCRPGMPSRPRPERQPFLT